LIANLGLKVAMPQLPPPPSQRLLPEYLPMTELGIGDWDWEDGPPPEPFVCDKCGCHSPAFAGGDSIMHLASGMVHYTFWRCLNPDCNHWWMLGDGDEE